MNVSFPEAQHGIAALGEVRVARPVSSGVGLLDGVKRGEQRGVGVPEITVPLNDDPMLWQECIDYELATDDLLLNEGNAKRIEDDAASRLQAIRLFVGGESQRAVDAFHVGVVVAAGMAAVLDGALDAPARNVERFAAGNTPLHDAATPCVDGIASSPFFGGGRLLPCVRAFDGTEGNRTAATGDKLLAAMPTGVCATSITTTGRVRAGQERLPAFLARLGAVGNGLHALIIPWTVA